MAEVKENIRQADSETQGKVISLFKFIRELNNKKNKDKLHVVEYPWCVMLKDVPDDKEYITVGSADRSDADIDESSDVLLAVRRPEFTPCPKPNASFSEWLAAGWEDFASDVEIVEPLDTEDGTSGVSTTTASELQEKFDADARRVRDFAAWQQRRENWRDEQLLISATRHLFSQLYRIYTDLERDSETLELIVANGFIMDRDKKEICHPLLTHRVAIDYDTERDEIYIKDTNTSSQLYTNVFNVMENINMSAVNQATTELERHDYHPLDHVATPHFLRSLVRELTDDNLCSEDGVPANWQKQAKILLYDNPCYILRKRLDGTVKAIDKIIENIQDTNDIPSPLRELVSGSKIELPEEDDGVKSIEEQLAEVGGESADVLLSKQANKEQLEIARRIERYNAVLVQGPPGTGKTHTIANLMGHFLAQGKNVLVTSHTPKALSVLKEKVAGGLQNLCVTVLDDSNKDMERSVDGIIDYMSRHNAAEMKRLISDLAIERKDVIKELAKVRKKIFAIINQECNSIVYNGEEFSPSAAARFIVANAERLNYIPGQVQKDHPLPLSYDELVELYRTNTVITRTDEQELAQGLPQLNELMPPTDFAPLVRELKAAVARKQEIAKDKKWKIEITTDKRISIEGKDIALELAVPQADDVRELQTEIASFREIEPWKKAVVTDGKNGGGYREQWTMLTEAITAVSSYAESIITEQLGRQIELPAGVDYSALKESCTKLRPLIKNGSVGLFAKMLHPKCKLALDNVRINGEPLNTAEDCDIVLHHIELLERRAQCARLWDALLPQHGVPSFAELDAARPESIAQNWIEDIHHYLGWYQRDYGKLQSRIKAIGLAPEKIFAIDNLDSAVTALDKVFYAIEQVVPALCETLLASITISTSKARLTALRTVLTAEKRAKSTICHNLKRAVDAETDSCYESAYRELAATLEKIRLQQRRAELLSRLKPIAPDWAQAIERRSGIHGEEQVPTDVLDAWKWKQLSLTIADITAQPFSELQARSAELSAKYRDITAQFAEKKGWHRLLLRTENNTELQQALQGWKQTVKKIGKGTGKRAPQYKAEARKLMSKCQLAVPAWIMPINKALDTLNPKENKFDVVIIDEASQSDISSLAILYMGKKLIIVGDDKQVSPTDVGGDIDTITNLQRMYIEDRIPNAHLYDLKTSIYDLAATTFPSLMLKEHFRCVPEIIGFSNMLSYNYQIKPLRDASSSNLLPAVVNYRVTDGQRDGGAKTNVREAETIVALMQACLAEPEYAGKTFGVISLLGDEQVKLLQTLIAQNIDPKTIKARRILCGNSANFQGDERDVIFISLVDSGEGVPLRMMSDGPDDMYRKRYNVAASRAKDQLWVVNSLDAATELKSGDIRRKLIEYAMNPNSQQQKHEEIVAKADSPFEVEVADYLTARGYHIVQQWPVGAYRIDMVAICGENKIAIECDGERYHSGEAKIREDMARQTVLERIGWRFIRIRGSEYYSGKEAAMERVLKALEEKGISPESAETPEQRADSELLARVRSSAARIMAGEQVSPYTEPVDMATITVALATPDNIAESQPSELEMIVSERKPVYKAKESVQKPKQVKKVTTRKPATVTAVTGDKVIDFLTARGIAYVDKRPQNGALWIVGGREMRDVVMAASKEGISFKFKKGGGKMTDGKDGWWTK